MISPFTVYFHRGGDHHTSHRTKQRGIRSWWGHGGGNAQHLDNPLAFP
jgi:hypothetical protein